MYKYSGKDKSCFLPFSWRFMTFAVLVLILSRTGAINAIKSYNNKLLLMINGTYSQISAIYH